MIRINLLGLPKSKGKRAPVASVLPGEGVNLVLKVLIVFAVAAGANFYYWYRLDHERAQLAEQTAQAQRKNQQLAEVKAKYLEREKQMQVYKRRVDVIDQLRANQFGPVNLMTMLGSTINSTEAVWLNTVKDEGNNIQIEGMALSQDAVANLIANLQKSGYFRSVEMRESFQDEQFKEAQAFAFILSCEKQKS